MALVECQHHSAERQRTAGARGEQREELCTAVFGRLFFPSEPELFDLFEKPRGTRLDLVSEPHGVQDQLQRNRVPVLRMTRDEVDVREYDMMEEVVQLLPFERAQLRTDGEVGAALSQAS